MLIRASGGMERVGAKAGARLCQVAHRGSRGGCLSKG